MSWDDLTVDEKSELMQTPGFAYGMELERRALKRMIKEKYLHHGTHRIARSAMEQLIEDLDDRI